jgi:hypothetical protein
MPIEIGKLVINLNLKGNEGHAKGQSKAGAVSESEKQGKIKEMIEEHADEIIDIISKKNER